MQPASNPVDQLSVIDVSRIDSHTGDQLLEAASKLGFLYVRNHGFTAEDLDRIFDLVWNGSCAYGSCCLISFQSRQFFKSPREEKQRCAIGPDVCNNRVRLGLAVIDFHRRIKDGQLLTLKYWTRNISK